jgi:hypothetical protein
MDQTPKIRLGEIREALRTNKNLAATNKTLEGSRVDGGYWVFYDSSLNDIASTFSLCIPKIYYKDSHISSTIFLKYIKDNLPGNNHIGIEFGGPGSNFFNGFDCGFFKKTIGVCLDDIRDDTQKEKDGGINHNIIPGDIMDIVSKEGIYNKLKTELGGEKVDLIVSRMVGPLDKMDMDSAILDKIIRIWYEMLSEKGVMFIQISFSHPEKLEKITRLWLEKIKEKFPQIEIQEKTTSENASLPSAIRIQKRPGAPDKLPRAKELFV